MELYTDYTDSILELARFSLSNQFPISLWDLFVEAIDEPENPAKNLSPVHENHKKLAVVLVTGGLDSTILYHRAKNKHNSVTGLYIDFGQPYAQIELDVLDNLGIGYQYAKVDMGYKSNESKWKHIIPARNLIAIDMAGKLAGKDGHVYFGVTDGESPEHGGDKSQKFLLLMKEWLRQSYGVIGLHTLLDGNKTQNIRKFLDDGGDIDIILNTYSCFNGESHKQCGRCQSCLRHYIALANNGIPEDVILEKYEISPINDKSPYILKYRELMEDDIQRILSGEEPFRYNRDRIIETLGVIGPDILDKYDLR